MSKELKAKKIQSGTVIDHIDAGRSPWILKILGFENFDDSVIIAMNVGSKSHKKKDIIKVENKDLSKEKIDRIALVSPDATINIIKNYEVKKKKKVNLPKVIKNIAKCPNRNCISNFESQPVFNVEGRSPERFRCHYCERILLMEDLIIS